MGFGGWSHATYSSTSAPRAFTYSTTAHATAAATGRPVAVHPSLDPKGLKFRESRDSVEHPLSVPIAVWLDTTGSNIDQARIVHKAMPTLMGLLVRKGYVTDPQIMFSALGDATCDSVPLEVGQFESDNRMDEQLGNFSLYGGGGGSSQESYELPLYVMARHTVTDAWEKRGRKGYMFMVGDEMAYDRVKRREVDELIGKELESDIPLKAIVEEVMARWELFYILPKRSSHGHDPAIPKFWKPLLGQRFLEIEDAEQIVPRIAAEIGAGEGMSIDTIATDLVAAGVDSSTVAMVKASVKSRNSAGIATVIGGELAPSDGASGTIRL